MGYRRAIVLLTVFIAAILTCSCATPVKRSGSIDTAFAELALRLLENSDLRKHTVAIGEFKREDAMVTALSAHLAGSLELALAKKAKEFGFQLLDRRHLGELVAEWELGIYGYVDDKAFVQAGKLLGVEVLFFGRHHDNDDSTIHVRVTMVNAETGEVLGAAEANLEANSGLASLRGQRLQRAREVRKHGNAKEGIEVELWTSKTSYHIGDTLRFNIRGNQDGYLTLIDVGTDGEVKILFPNQYAPFNAIKAGVTYTVPGPRAGYDFEVLEPEGIELLRAIVSKEPVVDLDEAMGTFDEGKPFGEPARNPALLARNIHIKAQKATKGSWGEAVIRLTILQSTGRKE